jgi:hypothetical protein
MSKCFMTEMQSWLLNTLSTSYRHTEYIANAANDNYIFTSSDLSFLNLQWSVYFVWTQIQK